jgi:hypothetical protein
MQRLNFPFLVNMSPAQTLVITETWTGGLQFCRLKQKKGKYVKGKKG